MKKISLVLSSLVFLSFGPSLLIAQAKGDGQPVQETDSVKEKFNIMWRDQNADTDTLAIPYDDSEVEDEEELDRAMRRNAFDLPTPPSGSAK